MTINGRGRHSFKMLIVVCIGAELILQSVFAAMGDTYLSIIVGFLAMIVFTILSGFFLPTNLPPP